MAEVGAGPRVQAGAMTVAGLLETGAAGDVALAAPGRAALTFRGLREHLAKTSTALNAAGVGRGDRVAIVLPNGPEMASAFLSVAASASTAPLNPAYREDEFDFYLSDLRAKALIVEAGSETPALAVARRQGIAVLELHPEADGPAGLFTLAGDGPGGTPATGGFAEPGDEALVLHTSGTTSRPKIVPLTQTNICASARNIRQTLTLSPGDRCLNIMPLFHIHGLIAATLSALGAGGRVFCSPGFNALRFFAWLEESQATWYTAVPTMHQAVLTRAPRNRDIIAKAKLRFVRSSSASLPPQVMADLEDAFGAPVIESYGMTEAAHQMTSNPLPPAARKAGTVGVPAGPDVAVMDPAGNLLSAGAIGEVVIRGDNVTSGYENNPKENAEAFTNGWLRTGDQGRVDDDGYLTITGRLKEIINRGGEKISPREVDEVLMDFPAVAQAVTFALPHDKLGEEVAPAVVLREGAQASEREIRDYAATRLAGFKVPRQVLILDEIPKGATGKLKRIGLADQLGLTGKGAAE